MTAKKDEIRNSEEYKLVERLTNVLAEIALNHDPLRKMTDRHKALNMLEVLNGKHISVCIKAKVLELFCEDYGVRIKIHESPGTRTISILE